MKFHYLFETCSWASVIGAIMGVLPVLSVLFGTIYWGIMIFEKVTGRSFHRTFIRWLKR